MAGGRERLHAMHDRIKKLSETTVSVGVHKDAGRYSNGMTVAYAAIVNQLGSIDGKIPARPFMSIAKRESDAQIKAKMLEAAKAASKGGDGVAVFKQAGEILEKSAKGVIDAVSVLRPNAPSTIKKKGRNHPLYDTGKMRDSIKTKVEK